MRKKFCFSEKKRIKKTAALLVMASALAALAGCAGGASATGSDAAGETQKTADLDLTALSSTMVYSEVYNMMVEPDDYEGKSVKVKGKFSVYHDEESGKDYFACLIPDASECCSQGLEFQPKEGYQYPDDYPKAEEDIVVQGVFGTYEENGNRYCCLKEARFL